ncbi:MAG: hypothetical protein AB1Z98_08950 [Nannocystaceae bacterium]
MALLLACGHTQRTSTSEGGDIAAAQRIYVVAEQHYAKGNYPEAVDLIRHALLQLPPSPTHDEMRHKLLLRMAHTQLRASAATADAAPLLDAQQMLTRYVERHEQLFGESEVAMAQRGEVYELLYEVERRLEPPAEDEAVADAGPPSEADPRRRSAAAAPADPAREPLVEAVEPMASASAEDDDDGRTARDEAGDSDRVRNVVVRNSRLASLDDPRVMERLRSDFSVGWAGLVLTRPGVEMVHEARPLVRGTSRATAADDLRGRHQGRRAGQQLLRSARESLRECYADAFTRETVDALESTVEASIQPDGSVRGVRIVDGGLIDGTGDACLIEALQDTALPADEDLEEPVDVQVSLTFFYQGARYIVEGTGEQISPTGVVLRPNPRPDVGVQGALPRSQDFVDSNGNAVRTSIMQRPRSSR